MKQVLALIQVILALILVWLILLQSKGTGLGSTFGGDLSFYSTKRGAEKAFFILTIVIASLFFVLSLIGVIL